MRKKGVRREKTSDGRKGIDMEGYQAFYESTPFKFGIDLNSISNLWSRLGRTRGVHKLRAGRSHIRAIISSAKERTLNGTKHRRR